MPLHHVDPLCGSISIFRSPDDKIEESVCLSVKTITYESLNIVLRLINGSSALLLAILPYKTNMLEGIHGWELRPSFRGPRLPRWMENGVSSFNQFVHELAMDSDSASSVGYSSGEEVDDDDDDDDDDDTSPSSHSSQGSQFSRASSYTKHEKNRAHWIFSIFLWFLLPARLIPFYLYSVFLGRGLKEPTSTPGRFRTSHVNAGRKLLDHVVERATDRRRGVIEDIHLGMEIFIETIFDGIHKIAVCVLSPMDSFRALMRWSSVADDSTFYVTTATLAEHNPTPTVRKTRLNNSLNTDARTCQDVITELGYPYEAINVITADGYVLLLERIPSWVSNGFVGSPAFAAFDQGYDVFLGNFRGLVSREHVNKNLSSREYWRYSINEHGTEDIPAMIEKIHEVKTSELKSLSDRDTEQTNTEQPYKLCAIGHSLGGAAILMYIITRRVEQKPHSSNWIGVMGLPHYNMNDMPGVSYGTALHLAQMKHAQRFRMFDYGSPSANMRVYGLPEPLDLGEYYVFIDVPVDLVAGKKDKVVRPSMVRLHYRLMREAGVDVSYNEFEYAHLDFVFSLHREELTSYMMSRLLLVAPATKQKSLRLKRKDGEVICLGDVELQDNNSVRLNPYRV
ncbi:hypothetical protein L1987_47277 [Smallanthus sonchifolius]|uniref:Uncharacterized protein n=1 Tax=Smallanthus sonchifolius TaxID=185202 RepID=A0ACB9G3V4_9ASTR|nr:hypothetical protein L1987_47277 [Smallanthus sonchifolius]